MQEGMRLIVGLGNPGRKYAGTRHSAGFMVIDALADRFVIPLEKRKFDTVFGRGRIEEHNVLLAKPMAFMNRSGAPTRSLATYYRISGEEMLIVHDDIDLAFGRLKIKVKGGHGGHKGVRSLMDAFGHGDFIRVRIGIGRSETGTSVEKHVLGRFDSDEREKLDTIIARARDAVVSILCEGTKESMNRYNSKAFLNSA
jgi:PTH1 family peptidyl-tRNA hydrolase